MWQNKTLAITGGTGSFGKKMVEYALSTQVSEIRVISRDEFKHHQMQKNFRDDRLKFYIADIRDLAALSSSLFNVDYVFHAAALKQVPSCENFPQEAVKTNILGSDNVFKASIDNQVQSVIALSTDKAVYPVNSMGITKSLMEKIALKYSGNGVTKINITRYGNVLFSRGSVIPLFLDLARNNKPLTITESSMTRFLLPLNDAIKLVEYALFSNDDGCIFTRKSSAASVETIANAIKTLNSDDISIESIGIRPGEKLHETLLTEEEMSIAIDEGDYYKIPEIPRTYTKNSTSYSSDKTTQLSTDDFLKLITTQPEYKEYL